MPGKHDTLEEMNQIAKEIYTEITNPNISHAEKMVFMEMNALSMGMTADSFDISVREVWEICKKFQNDPNTPAEEPPKEKQTREEQIFWDSINEYEALRESLSK